MKRGHKATFDRSQVYFTWVIGGEPFDPTRLADRLLKKDVAESVCLPDDGIVRFAPRYRDIERTISDAERLAEVSEQLAQGRVRLAVTRFPSVAWAMALSVVRALFGHKESNNDEDDDSWLELASSMRALSSEIESASQKRQLNLAVTHAVEQQMYRQAYLETRPFVRLNLRHCRVTLFEGDNEARIELEMSLVAHRSGVLQFVAAVPLPDSLTAPTLIRLMNSGNVAVSKIEFPEAVLRHDRGPRSHGWHDPDATSAKEEGTQWHTFESHLPVGLDDLFNLYLRSVTKAGRLDLQDEWMCYPSVFVEEPRCCRDRRRWVRRHQHELAALMAKFEATDAFRVNNRWPFPENSSFSQKVSIWHSSTITVSTAWSPGHGESGRTTYDEHLSTLLVVENYLLQLWFTRLMTAGVTSASNSLRRARKTQLRLINGMEEYYQSALTSESARDDVQRMLTDVGADRAHDHARDRLEGVSGLLSASRSERLAHRSLLAAVGALILAASFGLPAIVSTLELSTQIPESSWLFAPLSPLRGLADQGAAGAWSALIGVLTLLTALMLAGSMRVQFSRKSRQKVGYEWPRQNVQVVQRDK